ncbi:hypothetical protein BGW80DRAFT_1420616 [Lactifluus volemus]|nr:hypothetical protein BGW80DRAFT_1420616 [Lactifluus volemus]
MPCTIPRLFTSFRIFRFGFFLAMTPRVPAEYSHKCRPLSAKTFGLSVRFQVSTCQHNRCLLFVPHDEAPSESGLPAAA